MPRDDFIIYARFLLGDIYYIEETQNYARFQTLQEHPGLWRSQVILYLYACVPSLFIFKKR